MLVRCWGSDFQRLSNEGANYCGRTSQPRTLAPLGHAGRLSCEHQCSHVAAHLQDDLFGELGMEIEYKAPRVRQVTASSHFPVRGSPPMLSLSSAVTNFAGRWWGGRRRHCDRSGCSNSNSNDLVMSRQATPSSNAARSMFRGCLCFSCFTLR